jgi:beta-lactamase class A
VFLPNGRKYVLVILSKNLQKEDQAIKMMADVSEMIYKYVSDPDK